MRAPDKIHIGCCDPSLEWGFATSSVIKMKSDDIEYIRKDLLLEWANEMKGHVGLGLNAYDMGEENGKADMLNALIDKLNSM